MVNETAMYLLWDTKDPQSEVREGKEVGLSSSNSIGRQGDGEGGELDGLIWSKSVRYYKLT